MKMINLFKIVVFFFTILFSGCFNKKIEISNQITKEVYFSKKIAVDDVLSFEWEHSFEHIIWKEFYRIKEDKNFQLFSIAVEGFGAGIPSEMECTYRYEDGMIYMENIKNSNFKEFNWINSKQQLKAILINGELIISGKDLPEREKIRLSIK